jgi:hypothetical protein
MFRQLLVSLVVVASALQIRMGLDPNLTKAFPRDFKKIPFGTDYGTGSDEVLNKKVEARRLEYLEKDLLDTLKEAITTKERPMFTTALIAGMTSLSDILCIFCTLNILLMRFMTIRRCCYSRRYR